jgi:hypothetical protein
VFLKKKGRYMLSFFLSVSFISSLIATLLWREDHGVCNLLKVKFLSQLVAKSTPRDFLGRIENVGTFRGINTITREEV